VNTLRFTSCQAPVAEAFCAEVVAYVGRRLGTAITVTFVDDVPWPERLRRFARGRIHVCWMCGLPYSGLVERGAAGLELLAAPVMTAARYGGRPVYFSEVVVRRDAPFRSFADLRGARWAYNEPTSHSGYNAVRSHLARLGETRGYFGRAVAAGSHEASVGRILSGRSDAAAIDSTVLELLRRRDPGVRRQLRVVERLGPSPMPPFVASRIVPSRLRDAIRRALVGMDRTEEGRAILRRGLASRFAAVRDRDYDVVRRMAREARGVRL
jgi:phosphonate transport system substrate-binding protein